MNNTSKKVETHFHRKYKEFDNFYQQKKGFVSRCIDHIFRRSMRMRFQKVINAVSPYEGKSILDVGCGAGRYIFPLARLGIQKALGVDFAENMIEAAKHQAREIKLEHICSFQQLDFIQLDETQTFDHVFAMGVLDYIENPSEFVAKMVRLSRNSVMISFPSSGGIVQFFRKLLFKYKKKCPLYFYTQADVRQLAQKAGGKSFTIDRMAKDFFLTIDVVG